jgi:hypothetical protein
LDFSGIERVHMPLAAILGVSLLLALPSSGEAPPTLVSALTQAAQAQQDSQADSSQQPPESRTSDDSSAQTPAPSTAVPKKDCSSEGSEPQTKSNAEPPSEQAPAGSAQQPETSKPASANTRSSKTDPGAKTSKSTAAKAKKHHRKHPKKHPKKTQVDSEPSKVVVPNGGTSDPNVQLAPSLTRQQAANQRQDTNQLLASTESNLKAIADSQLKSSQQDVVKQIEQYVAQAKEATKAGDLERAHNLALKAQLLSEELVKH